MTDAMPPTPARPRRRGVSPAILKARYRAERRFRLYGMLAIFVAGAMLAALLTSIVGTGLPAFFETRIRLDVTLPAEDFADYGRDPGKLRHANFAPYVREALTARLPGADRRAEQRAAFGLIESNPDLAVRDAVLADPSRIGTTFPVWFRASDQGDLFAKGSIIQRDESAGAGIAEPDGTAGEIRIASSGDDFAEILAGTKAQLLERAAALEEQAERDARAAEVRSQEAADLEAAIASGDAPEGSDVRLRILEGQARGAAAAAETRRADARELRARASDPDAAEPLDNSMDSYFVRINSGIVKVTHAAPAAIEGTVLTPLADTAPAAPGAWTIVRISPPASDRKFSDRQIAWWEHLVDAGAVETRFNVTFFTSGDSRQPEQAGILGAIVGSLLTLLVTLVASFPVAVLAAIYLEEFAPTNWFTSVVEVSINNLAAVPSIVFGLLGLAVFLGFFGLPRSAPLVGGLVLGLMTLPTVIIAARAALKAVPPSIRDGARAVGASEIQVVTHHTLPLAVPGILTGTIIGMARALGETAPLLMIGMVAFIVDIPGSIYDAATVLPVQIYIWADSPERAFAAKTSAAILVLLVFLVLMNAVAVYLRSRFERRW